MAERARAAARWVVVAVLAVLALLSTRGMPARSRPPAPVAHRAGPGAVPAGAPVVSAAVVPAPEPTGEALAAVTDAHASCAARAAAVEQLRTAGDAAAIPALTAAARRDDCVSAAARAAVRELGRRETAAY